MRQLNQHPQLFLNNQHFPILIFIITLIIRKKKRSNHSESETRHFAEKNQRFPNSRTFSHKKIQKAQNEKGTVRSQTVRDFRQSRGARNFCISTPMTIRPNETTCPMMDIFGHAMTVFPRLGHY